MPTVTVFNLRGERVGERELSEAVFGQEPNEGLLHQVVVMQLANRRVGTVKTKTRAEVRGGGRKPWRQKGTGRARHGSIRSPLWRKGGVTFGPQPRDHGFTMPRRARRQALRQALSAKARGGGLVLVDAWEVAEPRTRRAAEALAALGLDGPVLVVTGAHQPHLVKSVRNLPGVRALVADDLNVYDVLAHRSLVMTLDAVDRVEEVLGA